MRPFYGLLRYVHYSPPKEYLYVVPKSLAVEADDAIQVLRISMDEASFYADEKKWSERVQDIMHNYPSISCVVFHSKLVESSKDYYCNVFDAVVFSTISVREGIRVMHEGASKLEWVERVLQATAARLEARMMGMLPANIATPMSLVKYVKETFRGWKGVRCRVWNQRSLHAQGFHLITSVGDSSLSHPPAMIMVSRQGKRGGKCICITGKGVTFDSGGLAIKPISHMKDQKYDKLGAIYAIGVLKLLLMDPAFEKHSIVCILPFAENAVSETATRPGDVIGSYAGKTVEVTNPDAEGRLLLADAMGYAAKAIKPDVLVDVATLTGHAEKVACWHHGYFHTSHPTWRSLLEKRTYEIGERMIAMPQWTASDEAILQSPVADLTNSPDDCADSLAATMFLKQFVPERCDWLHIDLSHSVNKMIPTVKGIRTVVEAIRVWLELVGAGPKVKN
jgi:leucyl aminopeptidase